MLCDIIDVEKQLNMFKNGGFVESKKLITSEAVSVIEQILREGKDVKITVGKNGVTILEVSTKRKYSVTVSGQ